MECEWLEMELLWLEEQVGGLGPVLPGPSPLLRPSNSSPSAVALCSFQKLLHVHAKAFTSSALRKCTLGGSFYLPMTQRTSQRASAVFVPSCSQQHYLQEPKTGSDPAVHQRMNKQKVAYPYSGILFGLQKRQS